MRPGWRFDGVDPSSAMIGQAKAVLGADARRVTFHEDTIDVAPPGPVDGATALLVLHFLERAERLATLRALADRLAPGAPLVVVHHSFPRTGGAPDRWLERNAALLAASGVAGDRARSSIAAMRDRLPVLDPAEDEALLAEAGFAGIELFYAAFTFKGWVGYRA
jgi:Trans-aconitate methyltransferase